MHRDDIQPLLNILSKLPTPPKITEDGLFEGYIHCVCCGKPIHIKTARIIKSPFKYRNGSNLILDPICPDCYKNVHDFAVFVCPVIQRVVARIKPFKDITGFEFKPRGLYHLDMSYAAAKAAGLAPENTDLFKSVILEKKRYDEQNKRIIVNL